MQKTVRLEARTDQGKVKTTELVRFRRPVMASTLAEIGLTLAEAKARLSKLQGSMLCDQLAEYAARCWVCPDCGVPQTLKDRHTRRLQTLLRCSTFPAGRSSPGTLRSRSRPGPSLGGNAQGGRQHRKATRDAALHNLVVNYLDHYE